VYQKITSFLNTLRLYTDPYSTRYKDSVVNPWIGSANNAILSICGLLVCNYNGPGNDGNYMSPAHCNQHLPWCYLSSENGVFYHFCRFQTSYGFKLWHRPSYVYMYRPTGLLPDVLYELTFGRGHFHLWVETRSNWFRCNIDNRRGVKRIFKVYYTAEFIRYQPVRLFIWFSESAYQVKINLWSSNFSSNATARTCLKNICPRTKKSTEKVIYYLDCGNALSSCDDRIPMWWNMK
jgi:hypothetical protein